MKSSAVRAQLEAIGFPDELHAQLDAALAHQAERSHTDPFSMVAQRVVCSDLIDHRQKAEAWPVVRVAPVQWLLPLRAAAERLGNDAKEWSVVVPVSATCSATEDPALAMLDVVARSMRHSAAPSHALGVLHVDGKAVSIAWPLEPRVEPHVAHEPRGRPALPARAPATLRARPPHRG